MAEIFRPVYHIDPATAKRVNSRFPGALRKKSKTWWIRYYLPSGERKKVKGYTDKKATAAKAAELERKAARLAEGLADPTDDHAKRPLAEHAEDFRRYLAAKQNTSDYVALTFARLSTVLDGCRFVRPADLQPSAVVEFLEQLRRGGKSLKTVNDYLAAVKGFTRWLWRDHRTPVDALSSLSKFAHANTDVRHARRDLSADELAHLLEAARTSPQAVRCLSGPDRYSLYLTAAATGFRASELASMTPESFVLDGETPTATVQASCTKNRRLAVQPLPLDAAVALRGYLASKPAGQPVWPGKWRRKAVFMIRADLTRARQTWLQSFQDARQRDEMAQSDFLGLPRRGRPLCRLP
jgi:integrase